MIKSTRQIFGIELQRDSEGQFFNLPADFELPGEFATVWRRGHQLFIAASDQEKTTNEQAAQSLLSPE